MSTTVKCPDCGHLFRFAYRPTTAFMCDECKYKRQPESVTVGGQEFVAAFRTIGASRPNPAPARVEERAAQQPVFVDWEGHEWVVDDVDHGKSRSGAGSL